MGRFCMLHFPTIALICCPCWHFASTAPKLAPDGQLPLPARLEASLVIRIILDRTSQQPCCPQCPGDHLVKDVAGHSIANHASLRCP